MGKINGCLKYLVIFFNGLFAILGCLLIYGASKLSAISRQLHLSAFTSPYLAWICLIAISILGISCLGIYAACSEKEILLKIFAGFMAVGMIIMLIFGIIMVVTRNEVKSSFDSAFTKVAEPFMEDEELKKLLEKLQQSLQCCGMASASDWGNNIPSSCECSSGSGCKSKPQGVSGPDQIYAQPCSKVMIRKTDSVLKGAMGLYFGFAAIALLGLLVSILMIHQVRRHDFSGGASIAMKVY